MTDFFGEQDVRIGKDFGSNTPFYYEALGEAFFRYFQTILGVKDNYNLLFENIWNRTSFASNFHMNLTRDITFSILGFHRYFELLIKDILRRINPFLAVKFLENESQIIKHLNNELKPETVNTIEFGEAAKRLMEASKWYNLNHAENILYKPAFDFLFLFQDDTLNRLTKWRNRIMHNGTVIPNIFQLDYLVTQRITPLIHKVFEIDKDILKDYNPHYFQTFSGINILEEISKIKFDYRDFGNEITNTELSSKFYRLAHLKEFGRATYMLSPFLKHNYLYYEMYYNNPLERYKRFAEAERLSTQFHGIKKCPCCNFETLVVYVNRQVSFFSWCLCTTCGFSLKSNLPDPLTYGYSKEKIFAES